jgi:UDP-N-acetyl-D-mannosaminuronic acid dehydrogenase
MKYQVGIVGLGRVGLPLALSFVNKGVSVIGFDINEDLNTSVKNKIMPFHEPGYEDILASCDLFSSSDFTQLKDVENIIITVGTPLLAHIETDLSQLKQVLNVIIKHLVKGQNIILRSTVAPKTSKFVHLFIENNTNFIIGKDIFLSFCPERIAEGKAREELESLPQIIGSEDNESGQRSEKLFKHLTAQIFHTDFVSAELVKLFNNTYRYINFSISNQFAIIAEDYGVGIYDIIKMANTDYPRSNIPLPGLTAGSCLRKDFGMINETNSYSDLLLNAWKINEFIPKFLVEKALENSSFTNKNIGILGYSFKKDTDDTRDSLVPKLVRYIEREVPQNIFVHEPNIPSPILDGTYQNYDLQEVLEKCEIIFIALNHSAFYENITEIIDGNGKSETIFVDYWNVSGKNQIIFRS